MKKGILLMASLFMVMITIQAQWVQLGSDVDGSNTGDNFGRSVSLSDDGMTFVSGAHNNDQNGSNAGQVRIYQYANDGWTQVGSDILGQQAEEGFGFDVSLNADGSVFAASAPNSSGEGGVTGCVRIYQNTNGSWTQIGDAIYAESADDFFGYSVSLNADGTIVASGAPFNNGSYADAGQVRVYQLTDGNWVQLGNDIDGEDANNYSGYSVSLNADGTIVAIGAPENTGNGNEAGHVRVYQFQDGDWVQMGSDIDAESAGDYLGYSVSLNDEGNILAASAIFDELNGVNSGSIYVYQFVDGDWQKLGNTIVGEGTDNNFGVSNSINAAGNIVAGGAPTNSGNGSWSGSTRVFQLIDNNWEQIGDDIDGEGEDDQSGGAVSLNALGSVVAIGADHNSNENGSSSGQVRVFQNTTVDVQENTFENLSLYPNPTSGRVTINLTENVSPHVYIYDVTGRVLYHKHLKSANNSLMIDMTDYQSGIYMIRIYDNQKTYSGKIIKR
jgi:hypothetical protein